MTNPSDSVLTVHNTIIHMHYIILSCASSPFAFIRHDHSSIRAQLYLNIQVFFGFDDFNQSPHLNHNNFGLVSISTFVITLTTSQ